MKLDSNVSILFGNEVVTEQVLEKDREKWEHSAILPGIGAERFSDEEALYALMFETIPFTITADGPEPLIFQAFFKRFPYAINGKRNFASFGLRLVLKEGRVRSVELDQHCTLAINNLVIRPDSLFVDLGNGSLHLEIFFQPTKQPMEEVGPPAGFKEKRFREEG